MIRNNSYNHFFVIVTGFILTFLIFHDNAFSQSKFQKLVWQEEFDKDEQPDTERWNYDTAHGCPNCGWGNNEKQYYTNRPKNVTIENGILKIRAFRENHNGAEFTSGRIHTKNKFSVQYGRIEARAKVPLGAGTWPAIWMLGSNIGEVGWPACGEIDILEHKGSIPNKIYGTLHYPGRLGDNADGSTLMIENATNEFQVYAVEWNKEKIKILVNDQLVHEVINDTKLPFHSDFFILVNMAIGGGFAGPVDPAFEEATFEIDYIRVYK